MLLRGGRRRRFLPVVERQAALARVFILRGVPLPRRRGSVARGGRLGGDGGQGCRGLVAHVRLAAALWDPPRDLRLDARRIGQFRVRVFPFGYVIIAGQRFCFWLVFGWFHSLFCFLVFASFFFRLIFIWILVLGLGYGHRLLVVFNFRHGNFHALLLILFDLAHVALLLADSAQQVVPGLRHVRVARPKTRARRRPEPACPAGHVRVAGRLVHLDLGPRPDRPQPEVLQLGFGVTLLLLLLGRRPLLAPLSLLRALFLALLRVLLFGGFLGCEFGKWKKKLTLLSD